MYYSRPIVESLGWDLKELPIANGSRNYIAITTENVPVGFRFSSGWLEVRKSMVGGTSNFFEMGDVIFKQSIAPFGTTDIFPEQICDILGITVLGQSIPHPDQKVEDSQKGAARYIDLSGTTTYWRQSLFGIVNQDVVDFVNEVQKQLDCALLKLEIPEDYKPWKFRIIDFMNENEDGLLMVFDMSKLDLAKSLDYDLRSSFPFTISMYRSHLSHRSGPAKQLIGEKYDLGEVEKFNLSADIKKNNPLAPKVLGVIEKILNNDFFPELVKTEIVFISNNIRKLLL